jgi:hypothetical protein
MIAADMVMEVGCAVKTLLGAAYIQFLDDSAFRHDLKVAVNRAQADFRQPFAHHLVKHIGGGMRGYSAQFVKNDLALFGDPQTMAVELRHGRSPQVDNNSYLQEVRCNRKIFFIWYSAEPWQL